MVEPGSSKRGTHKHIRKAGGVRGTGRVCEGRHLIVSVAQQGQGKADGGGVAGGERRRDMELPDDLCIDANLRQYAWLRLVMQWHEMMAAFSADGPSGNLTPFLTPPVSTARSRLVRCMQYSLGASQRGSGGVQGTSNLWNNAQHRRRWGGVVRHKRCSHFGMVRRSREMSRLQVLHARSQRTGKNLGRHMPTPWMGTAPTLFPGPRGRCTHQLAAICAPRHTVATPINEQLGPRGRGPCLR